MTGFRLEHLSLVDFRCFDRLELDFHPEITLLVGRTLAGSPRCSTPW
jgi:predicted ATP-binding protein involved in virulence